MCVCVCVCKYSGQQDAHTCEHTHYMFIGLFAIIFLFLISLWQPGCFIWLLMIIQMLFIAWFFSFLSYLILKLAYLAFVSQIYSKHPMFCVLVCNFFNGIILYRKKKINWKFTLSLLNNNKWLISFFSILSIHIYLYYMGFQKLYIHIFLISSNITTESKTPHFQGNRQIVDHIWIIENV